MQHYSQGDCQTQQTTLMQQEFHGVTPTVLPLVFVCAVVDGVDWEPLVSLW